MTSDAAQRAAAIAEAHPEVRSATAWEQNGVVVVAAVPRLFISALEVREHVRRNLGDAGTVVVVAVGAEAAEAGAPLDDLRAHGFDVSAYAAPTNEVEGWMCAQWTAALGVDQVGLHDDLLDLGGDSMVVFQIQAAIAERWGVELPLNDIFELATPARVAEALGERRPSAPGSPPDRSG